MATTTEEQNPAGVAASQPQKSQSAQAERKLTGAELKAKTKAEKAARRAAAKAAAPTPAQPAAPQQAEGKPATGGKTKGKQDAAVQPSISKSDKVTPAPLASGKPKKKKPDLAECFSHLPIPQRVSITEADEDVHMEVLLSGKRISSFALRDSISRASSLLLAFKEIIKSYETPKGTCLSRHFTSHILNRQIEYLTSCRPLCVAMGNTIRWLKLQVAEIDVEQSDESAKEQLCAAIDQFILQRIVISNKSVIQQGARRVEDGDSILVFGGHTLVQDTLLAARREGKKFEVIIVDDVFDSTGVAITKSLRQAGIPVMYCPDMALGCIQACRTTKTFVAAEAVFEDGSVYARAGSADIACATVAAQNSLLVLCQSLNISDKMPTDSLTYNEMDPDRASNAGGVRLLYDVIKPAETVIIILEDSGVTPHLITEKFKKLDFL